MLTVRPLIREDIAQVCELEKMAFSMPWKEADFLDMLANKDALYLVAEDEDGVIAASCGLLHIVGEGDISNVVVRPQYRRRGIAKWMLTRLLEEGKERFGITTYTLEVRKSNEAAVSLYETLGFVTEGIRKNFYEKPVEDALIMWKR